jgi:WD40 repeat protein
MEQKAKKSVEKQKSMKRILFLWLLIAPLLSSSNAQVDSYILKRQIFKVPLTSINISPDGKKLLGGYNDGAFRILNAESFESTLEVKQAHHKAVNAIDMPPKMDFILSAGFNTIKLWDLQGKQIAIWNAHATTIWNAEISRDGKYAISSAFNKTFILWDVYNSEVLEQMKGHEDVTMAVSISPDSRFIASGSKDQTVKIWDMETLKVIKTLHGPAQDVYDLEFSPNGQLLAVASKDHSVRIYNLLEEDLVFLLKGHRDMVLELEFSPDGSYLISGSADQSVILWDVLTGEKIHNFIDNEEAVMDLVYHPNGKSFYSISYARDLTRWEIDPEIFVLRYFDQAYRNEISTDPLFEPRRQGESKKDHQDRESEASAKKTEIIDFYYKKYLTERGQ